MQSGRCYSLSAVVHLISGKLPPLNNITQLSLFVNILPSNFVFQHEMG